MAGPGVRSVAVFEVSVLRRFTIAVLSGRGCKVGRVVLAVQMAALAGIMVEQTGFGGVEADFDGDDWSD